MNGDMKRKMRKKQLVESFNRHSKSMLVHSYNATSTFSFVCLSISFLLLKSLLTFLSL